MSTPGIKKYTEGSRSSAVKLYTEQKNQITENVRNLSMNATMLGRWKREVADGSPDSVSGREVQAVLTRFMQDCSALGNQLSSCEGYADSPPQVI